MQNVTCELNHIELYDKIRCSSDFRKFVDHIGSALHISFNTLVISVHWIVG